MCLTERKRRLLHAITQMRCQFSVDVFARRCTGGVTFSRGEAQASLMNSSTG